MCKSCLEATLNFLSADKTSANVRWDPKLEPCEALSSFSMSQVFQQTCFFIPPSLLNGLSLFEHFGGMPFQETVGLNVSIYPVSTSTVVINKKHHGLFGGSRKISKFSG